MGANIWISPSWVSQTWLLMASDSHTQASRFLLELDVVLATPQPKVSAHLCGSGLTLAEQS